MKLLIIGATGRSGQHIVDQALQRGHEVVALARSPQKLAARGGLTVVTGSPMSGSDVASALVGCDAVLVALKNARKSDNPWAKPVSPPHLLEDSIKTIAAEMDNANVKRLVMISALGVADSFADAPWIMRMIIPRSNAKIAFADHDAVDAFLHTTNLDWILVRAVALSNADGSKSMIVSDGKSPKPAMSISRSNLARFMLDALEGASHIRATPVLSEK
jgi:putative NADH-flavin reductase